MPSSNDKSHGYERIAEHFIAARNSRIGPSTVQEWCKSLRPGCAILDVACGHGVPITQTLVDQGFQIYGVDASPTLLAEFSKRFPSAQAQCSAAENSDFFGRTFDGIICWGLMFILPIEVQHTLILKIAGALNAGGKFLFTSTRGANTWNDSLTGEESHSPGAEWYRNVLSEARLIVERETADEGENYYFFTAKA
jgi:2-polyprenyl-3-methyl-5-hydroxy-6-metoxy-1,4-benzoquinol methylase